METAMTGSRTTVEDGDLVVIQFGGFGLTSLSGEKHKVLGWDREGRTVDIDAGTLAIAYEFHHDGQNRWWWIFLPSGRKVRVAHHYVRSMAHAGKVS